MTPGSARRRVMLAALVTAVCGAAALSPVRGRQPRVEALDAERYRLLAIEDARPHSRAEAGALTAALSSSRPSVVRQAVRALGRLEHPDYLQDIFPALAHDVPAVRAEAAQAAAHAAGGRDDDVVAALLARVGVETDSAALGAVYGALGRIVSPTSPARAEVEPRLARVVADVAQGAATRLGAARSLESLARRVRATPQPLGDRSIAALRVAARGRETAQPPDELRTRYAAILALNTAGAVDAAYEHLAADGDDQIRRLAMAGAGSAQPLDTSLRLRLIAAGLADSAWSVRYEALRAHGRHVAATACDPQVTALRDPNPHIVLLAIDQLGTACPGHAGATARLQALVPADTIGAAGGWHAASHALVALARRDPELARVAVADHARHANWHVREYAARAAAVRRDAGTLRSLAADARSNVRAAALEGLAAVDGHAADAVFVAALSAREYPVVMAAAAALAGSPDRAAAVPALERALAALSAPHMDTSRDARLAVIDRLAELGTPEHAEGLRSYLADPDPRIAARAAEVMAVWTGRPMVAATTRVRTLPLPPLDTLEALPRGLRVHMARGGSFDIVFDLDVAPVAAWRVADLARRGHYNGLTWHRILPNFIIQGGSPLADEYVGDGPFMRDELSSRSHVRGSVGISTRGHDTGDAQLFVNLVDSPRLDHDYTVIGEVSAGMEVVDAVLEGDVMTRVEWLRGE